MFKFSKRKQNKDTGFTPEMIDVKVNTQSSNATDATQLADGNNVTETSDTCFDEAEVLVTRLKSLDSGISVDKSSENKMSPIRQTNDQMNPDTSTIRANQNEDICLYNLQENLGRINDTENKEVQYINKDHSEKEYVYINKSNVNIHELENSTKPMSLIAMMPVSCMQNKFADDQYKAQDEKMSNISSDSLTSMGLKEKVDDIRNPVKSNRNKKSWSFQSGGKKKIYNSQENDSSSKTADVSRLESKKPKWRLGKFSFRRRINEKYISTPNLKNPVIREEGETTNVTKEQIDQKMAKQKQTNKMKKTKNKANGTPKLERGSATLLEVILGSNAPRSKYSIVEDDIHIASSDAFGGVSLSDLSLAGNEEVSTTYAKLDELEADCIKSQGVDHLNKSFDDNSNSDYKFKLKLLVTSKLNQSAETLHTHEVGARKSVELGDPSYSIIGNVSTTDDVEYAQVVKPKHISGVVENRVHLTHLFDQADQNEIIDKETQISNKVLDVESESAEILNMEKQVDLRVLLVSQNEWQPDIGKEQNNLQDENVSDVHLQQNVNEYSKKYQSLNDRHPLQMKTNLPNIPFASMKDDDNIGVSTTHEIVYNNKESEGHITVNAVNEQIQNTTILEQKVKPTSEFMKQHNIVTTVDNEILASNLKPNISSRKVVIMKEVGLQVPDVYIPLDIEYINKVACVSIGVQVTADELEAEHINLDIHNSNNIKANVASAYF